jgi:CHAD domain-containing protein
MGRKPAMRGGSTAGESLRMVARGILTDSRAGIEDNTRAGSAAVHDFRKSMKRWRALLRLLEPYVGEPGRKLRLEARDLARELAGPRDAQSALDGLNDTLKHDAKFSKRSLHTIRDRIDEIRKQAEGQTLSPEMRTRLSGYLRRALRGIERWPFTRIGSDEIAERLTQTYRRARRMLPDDWSAASADELHELRRRVIEHRYQMELVEPIWPRLGKAWVAEAQRLRDRLGRYQDLVVLTHMTAPRGPLAPWRTKLGKPIAERQDVHLAAAARLSGRLFAERPKAFQRRLQAIWKAGRT